MTQTSIRFRVDAASDRPLYEQIADTVARAVAAGAAAPGDPLPSVRELATELGVNLNTVSRAYRSLQERGLAVTRKGVGMFVAPDASPASKRSRLRKLDPALDAIVAETRELGLAATDVLGRLESKLRRGRPETGRVS